MYHNEKRGKGVHIRGGTMKNVLLRADSTYSRVLSKCVQELYSEEDQKKFEFYIADSKGVAIWNGDKIEVDIEESGQKKSRECDWTLEKYIRLSNARYPSKARFFCVKKDKGNLG